MKMYAKLCMGIACILLCQWDGVTALAQGNFKVTLLGTGSPPPRLDRFGPSTLIEAGEQKLLFDAGRGATIRLRQLGIPIARIDALFITHFHSDHTVGIPDIWLTGWVGGGGRRGRPLPVIGPTGIANLMSHLEQAYVDDINIRIADQGYSRAGVELLVTEYVRDGVVYEAGGVRVTAFEVFHAEAIKPAYGYRIDYDGRSVVISGDTQFSENVIKYGRDADLLLHEVAVASPEIVDDPATAAVLAHHTVPRRAGDVFRLARPKLAAYTHIVLRSTAEVPEPSVDRIVAETRETYDGPLEVGEDLMTFEIGETVTVHRYEQ